MDAPTWIAAVARGGPHPLSANDRLLAHTTPVYVDVAGRRVARAADAAWCLGFLDRLEALATAHGSFDGRSRDRQLGDLVAVIEEARSFYRGVAGPQRLPDPPVSTNHWCGVGRIRHDRTVLADLWPLYGLTISTPRLELRLPHEEELAALAQLAADGVHRADERPFLTPWTDGSGEDRARSVLQGHWGQLAEWNVAAWSLGLAVFSDRQPLGKVTLRARDFAVVREVTTSSWLGIAHHGKGYGTEARVASALAGLRPPRRARGAHRGLPGQHASQGVSRKLGYEADGISVDARDGEALVSDRLRLTRQKWTQQERPTVRVGGMAACRRCSAFEALRGGQRDVGHPRSGGTATYA